MKKKNFLYVNCVNIYQLIAAESELEPYPLRLGNISKIVTVDNMKNLDQMD